MRSMGSGRLGGGGGGERWWDKIHIPDYEYTLIEGTRVVNIPQEELPTEASLNVLVCRIRLI